MYVGVEMEEWCMWELRWRSGLCGDAQLLGTVRTLDDTMHTCSWAHTCRLMPSQVRTGQFTSLLSFLLCYIMCGSLLVLTSQPESPYTLLHHCTHY